ncbi:hypothetical protein DFH29DRAFT_876016 [Suillus ampliporus]|nr:hypothetical protein DFH29DRAFT_876016 [Suillus ampliporus]
MLIISLLVTGAVPTLAALSPLNAFKYGARYRHNQNLFTTLNSLSPHKHYIFNHPPMPGHTADMTLSSLVQATHTSSQKVDWMMLSFLINLQIVAPVHLIPCFGQKANPQLTMQSSMNHTRVLPE